MPQAPSPLHRDAARNIVTKYLKIRPGENVIVESWDHTMPIAAAMVDEARRAGARTLHIHEDEDAWWRAIDRKQSKLLGNTSVPEWAALKAADVYVHFWGPADTDRLDVIPEKTFDHALDWFEPWYDVARRSGLRGARVAVGFATEGRARQWGLDRARWEDSMLRACLTDPVETAESASRLIAALARGKRVRITHSNGTDLEVGLAGKAPRLHDGTPHPRDKRYGPSDMLAQIPAGRVEVALDSKTADGRIHANRRTNIWWRWDSGGTLEFSDGRLTSYSFEEGAKDFSTLFERGTPGKDRTGALTIGLNPAVDDVPILESVERGNVSLSIGRNGHLHGTNRSNFMSWVTLAGADISVDGAPLVRAGRPV
ncbi:MAG TPA: aminopeptidase [Thermoplasmata archaeon]|nr:aminopeptidase [Thermoplasmata archaeon]